jgi:hypothetical protein
LVLFLGCEQSNSPEAGADDLEKLLLDSITHARNILHQPQTAETLATRVLDDAYHFMDRLLRLLSKKHPAYKECRGRRKTLKKCGSFSANNHDSLMQRKIFLFIFGRTTRTTEELSTPSILRA